MSLDLTCDTKVFSCSYSRWHNIRCELIEATFAYLEDIIAKEFDIDKDNSDKDNSDFNNLKQYINKIREYNAFERVRVRDLFDAYSEYSGDLYLNNILIKFGVGGIYSLCNKDEGFYSIGNSYDICQLITLIKPFTIKNIDNIDDKKNWVYNCMDILLEIFQESIEKKKNISIN